MSPALRSLHRRERLIRVTAKCVAALMLLAGLVSLRSPQGECAERDGLPTAREWPQYRGNAGFTGVSTDDTVKPPLKLAWTYRLDGDASGDAGAGVIVGGGKVFVPIHNTRSVLALDARHGRFLWEFRDVANSYRSVPTYDAGRVFIWQRGRAKEFVIAALDATTGAVAWSHKMTGEQTDTQRVGLPVWEGKLFVSEGGPTPSAFALDTRTGEVLWRTPLEGDHGSFAITPSIAGGKLFVATCNGDGFRAGTAGAIRALDAKSGKPLWTRAGLFPNRTLVSDGKIVVCSMYAKTETRNHVLNAETGEPLWTSPANFHYNPPTITNELVLIRPYGASCLGFERDTGKKKWDFGIPKVASGCCAPAVSGRYAYYGTGVVSPGDLEGISAFQHVSAPREQGISGSLHAVDLETGTSVWHFGTGNCICGDPAIAYGRLYFTSRDGMVYCFEPARPGVPTTPVAKDTSPALARRDVERLIAGPVDPAPVAGRDWVMQGGTPHRAGANVSLKLPLEPAWKFDLKGPVVTSASVRNGLAVVGSDAGTLYGFDLKTGDKRWAYDTPAKIRCAAAITEVTTYCGSDDGSFFALDNQTGTRKWRFEAGGPVRGSPTVVGGLVLFAAHDHHVYALDRQTGRKAWATKLNDYAIQAAPVVHEDTVFVGQWTDWVWALDLATGTMKWKAFIPVTIESLSFHRDTLYVRNPNYVVELDPRSGERQRLSYASWGWGGLAFANNRLFLSGIQSQYGTHGGSVIDLDDPGELLRTPVKTMETCRLRKPMSLKGRDDLASMGTPLVLQDKVAFAAVTGMVHITSLDGTKLWSHKLSATSHASPIAAAGHLLIGSDDGHLHVFRETSP